MASKANGLDTSDWGRQQPVGSAWQRILRTIYDPEEKSFFGRTAKRWGIVFTFYLVFYAVLALLFALCMGGLFYSLDTFKPTYVLDRSLIGINPGVAFRPRPLDDVVVKYNIENATAYDRYLLQLEEFLKPYENDSWFKSKSECNTDNYGYPDAPCFIIKLNKIYDWEPEFYDVNSLPGDMPEDLAEHIKGLDPTEQRQIWISCWEEKDNTTNLEYPWGRGLSNQFYPYRNQDGYRSPLLAVRITPKVNTAVFIRCRAWAKNIVYNQSLKEASGYTRIQIYIEDNTGDNEATTIE